MSVVVSVSISGPNAEVLGEAAVFSRGWVDGDDGDLLRKEAGLAVRQSVERALGDGVRTRQELERLIRRTIGRFVNKETRLRPIIVPVVLGAHEGSKKSDDGSRRT